MKKLILTLAAVVAFCSVQAQTTKGSVALTGSAGYSTHNSHQEIGNTASYKLNRYDYTLAPSIGFLVRDNLEVGIFAHFFKRDNAHQQHLGENSKITFNTIHNEKGGGLYGKQYKYLSEKLAVTGTLSFGLSDLYYQTKSVHLDPFERRYNTEQNTTRMWASLSPGFTYFASRKIALNMNLGALNYSNQTLDTKSSALFENPEYGNPMTTEYTEKKNTLSLDFSSMHLNLGLSFFIGK